MKRKSLTARELGKILFEEFQSFSWGDVDPDAFKNPPRIGEDDEMAGLYEVLNRTVERINRRMEA